MRRLGARRAGEEAVVPDRSDDRWTARDAALFLPRLVVLLGRLIGDPRISKGEKAILVAAAAYVASPIDLVPDFVPVLGQIDDVYLVALALLRFMNRAGEDALRRHWSGPEDIVAVLAGVTRVAVTILPSRIRHLVESRVERKDES